MPVLTGDFTDLLGLNGPLGTLVAWVETNVEGPALVDPAGDMVRLGKRYPLSFTSGQFSIDLPSTAAAAFGYPADTLRYQVHAEFDDLVDRTRQQWKSGWFALTTTSDLADVATIPGTTAPEPGTTASLIAFSPTPQISATDVQGAITELSNDTVGIEDIATKIDRSTRTAHAPALGVFFPEAEGAVADGVTNDSAAIAAATTAAGTTGSVAFRAGAVYGIGAQVAIAAGARWHGNGATLKAVASIPRIATAASNAYAERLTFDGNGLVTSYVVEAISGADTVDFDRCRFTSTGTAGPIGFRTLDGAKNITLTRPIFDNLTNCLKLDKNPDTVRIIDGVFTKWYDRAIWVISSAGLSTKNLWIESNLIRPHAVRLVGGVPDMNQVRQPIAIQGVDTDLHRNVTLINNNVIGAGTSHGDTTNPGSADLISVHRTDGLQVIGNTAEYGGDVGITVAQQCKDIVISGNITRYNDSAGICLGSATSTSCSDAAVVGNTSMNNGQNRLGDGPSWASNGINLNKCQKVVVSGNRCGDGQTTKTQLYGITAQGTTDVTIGANQLVGNLTSAFQNEGSNVRLTFDFAPVRATITADRVVNNSTALVTATGLTIPVGIGGIYEVEAYLIYNSSTTADLSLSWSAPAGAVLDWVSNAPASTTTGPNGDIQRTAFSVGSVALIGGAGANAVAMPTGTLTIGATAGNFLLQFAQGTAEVSDTIIRAGSWIKLTRIG